MAYVPVPKDLSQVKEKVLFNLTKRQLVCFGAGGGVSVVVFFCVKDYLETTFATLLMMGVAMPFFFLAMYERNGRTLEKIIADVVKMHRRAKYRPYKTKNYYSLLQEESLLRMEVKNIVYQAEKNKRTGKQAKASSTQAEAQLCRSVADSGSN